MALSDQDIEKENEERMRMYKKYTELHKSIDEQEALQRQLTQKAGTYYHSSKAGRTIKLGKNFGKLTKNVKPGDVVPIDTHNYKDVTNDMLLAGILQKYDYFYKDEESGDWVLIKYSKLKSDDDTVKTVKDLIDLL